jgi:hypothetical protein
MLASDLRHTKLVNKDLESYPLQQSGENLEDLRSKY